MHAFWPQIWGCWRTAAKIFFAHTVVYSMYFAKMIFFLFTINFYQKYQG